jgi:ABC-type transport system substrate-binding protein
MENEGKDPVPPSSPAEPIVPPRKPGSANVKWYAIIAVLIVIIAAFGVLAFYHPVSTGSSAQVVSAASIAQYNQPYNLTIKTNGAFQSITVYWGDGHTEVVPYSGTDTVHLSHTYLSPGSFYVYYVVNFGGSTYTSNMNLVAVQLTAASTVLNQNASYGDLAFVSASKSPLVNNSMLFAPGTNLSFLAGYFTPPANSNFEVVGQTINVYQNGTLVSTYSLPYYYDAASGAYKLPLSDAYFNLSNLASGYYELQVNTQTASLMSSNNVPTQVTNSTSALYMANKNVTYDNPVMSEYMYGNTPVYYNQTVWLSYQAGAFVKNYAGDNVTYETAANVSYMGTASLVNTAGLTATYLAKEMVNYTKGTQVSIPAMTNVTAGKGANLTLANGTELMLPSGASITVNTGANLTFLTNTSITTTSSAKNVTGGTIAALSSATAVGPMTKYAVMNFTAPGTITFKAAANVSFADLSQVNFTSGPTFMTLSALAAKFADASNFTYPNGAPVTYPVGGNIVYNDNTVLYSSGTSLMFNGTVSNMYNAGTTVYYPNPTTTVNYTQSATYTKGQDVVYQNSPVSMQYSGETMVGIHKGTQMLLQTTTTLDQNATSSVQYQAGTTPTFESGNVTFSQGSQLYAAASSILNVTAGANLTFLNNVTLTVKGTVSNGTGKTLTSPFKMSTTSANASFLHFNTTSTVTFEGNANFTLLTPMTVNFSASPNQKLTAMNTVTATFNNVSRVSYASGTDLTFMSLSNTTFKDETNIAYLNAGTNVTYLAGTTASLINSTISILRTYSGISQPIYTGEINAAAGLYQTSYFVDIPVFTKAATYSAPVTGYTFTNAEAETGGYKTLDPAIAYDTVSFEVIMNTMATLVGYNGSTSSHFFAYLAAYLPSTSNGGINTNYHNYTVKDPWGTTYAVNITPAENYTFHIRSNATFQNGQPVTAWDVMYSMVRTLLFDAGSPGTPGWIQAQYLLPGNYYETNTFWNITQNITVDNATNNITFHFQEPMSSSLVFEILGQASGMGVIDPTWLAQHGGAITWNATGFQAYKAHANAGDYISYLVNNVMASGPYEIDYTVPASETVLVANPNYNPPGNGWAPKPKIQKVVIEYIGQTSTRYLQLKSGYAQTAGIPSSDWYEVQGLAKAGTVHVYSFPEISIFWYNFNANINTAMLSGIVSSANVPQTFFDSLHVRRAFADAYNYSYYLSEQIGNAVYNTTFANGYAGMLPDGMLGYQNNASLRANGTLVPSFNLKYAKANWSAFETGGLFKAMGLVIGAGGVVDFNGAPLNIPIFIFSADPVDEAGATTWGTYLQQVIPGLQFEVVPTPFPNLLGYQVQGSNPMPIYELGWAPDYPYPTDYMGPMADPVNSSTYPGPNDMTPYWFNATSPVHSVQSMKDQAANLTLMKEWYDLGSVNGNPTVALRYFHKLNEMLVNMTFYVYIEQEHGFWIMNSHVSGPSVTNYQENVMLGGGGDLLYDYLSYT